VQFAPQPESDVDRNPVFALLMKRSFWILFFSASLSLVLAEGPAWWSQRGVITPQSAKTADDFAVLNQGQLKNLARAARDELNSKLTGGAGVEIDTLVQRWQTQAGSADDFAVVTVGQLKNAARLFLQRLHAVGQIAQLPEWTHSSGSDDHAVANIGQAKALFSFEVAASPSNTVTNSPVSSTNGDAATPAQPLAVAAAPPPAIAQSPDSNGDGIPDVDVVKFGLDPGTFYSAATGQSFSPDDLGRPRLIAAMPDQTITLDAEANITAAQ
jgi:hypothetical protein